MSISWFPEAKPAVQRGILAVVAAGMLFGASGCTRIRNMQGYIVDPELVASVQPRVDNKQSVEKTLGRPTLTSEWTDNDWYYISRTTEQVAYRRPRPVKQTLLAVHFANDGTVESVTQSGMEHVAEITPSKDKTPTLGRNQGILDDLFGNIGQVGSAPQ